MGAFKAKALPGVLGFALLLACVWSLAAGPLDRWNWLYPRPTGAHLNGVAFGAEQFIVVGANESILRSTDGTNWTLVRGLPNGTNLNAVCWGNGAFVAVGAQGLVLISSDGTNWVRRVPYRGDLTAVTFGDGLFIAVGGNTQTNWILASPNGFSWGLMLNVPAVPTFGAPLADVTWGADGFVAVGARPPSILFSPDGFSWQVVSNTQIAYELSGVTYGDGRYVATGPYTTVRSTNGSLWSRSDFVGHYNSDIAYGDGLYVAVGNIGVAGYSTNGSRWTGFPWGTFPFPSDLTDIAFGDGQFVAVGPNSVLANSVNGTNWAWQPALRMQYPGAMVCGPEGCVVTAVGVARTTSDFVNWTLLRSNANWNNLFYSDGWYIAPDWTGRINVSSNLVHWASVPSGTTNAFYRYARGNGLHVLAGDRGTIGVSSNALDWSAVYLGVNKTLGGVAFGNGRFVTLNSDGDVGISSNAHDWTYYPRLMPPNGISQLAFGNGVFVGLASTGLVVRSSDGLVWQSNRVTTNMYSAILSFNHGLFLVTAPVSSIESEGSSVFVSRFGTNWTRYAIPYLANVTASAMYGRRMIAADQGGRFVQSDLFPALGIRLGTQLELSLDGAPGFYRIEASDSPAGPWQFMTNVGAPWQGIQRPTAPQRFYRVASP